MFFDLKREWNFAQVNSHYLKGYFEGKAGPVSDIEIDTVHNPKDGKEQRIAYVTFVMPEDAAM